MLLAHMLFHYMQIAEFIPLELYAKSTFAEGSNMVICSRISYLGCSARILLRTLRCKTRLHDKTLLSEVILRKRLRNRTEHLAFSNQQRQEGMTDLAEFIANQGKKVVNEIINRNAHATLAAIGGITAR